MANILVCDDEKDIVNALKIYLSSANYTVYESFNGKEAIDIIKDNKIDLVLMDLMMPIMDGVEALKEIRSFSNVPVILLTAKSEDVDKILGLDIGADDYITKPFNPMEVLARVKSQLRRYLKLGSKTHDDKLTIGGIELDDNKKEVFVDGKGVSLTPKEFEILKLFMQSPGKVFSIKEIYQKIWQDEAYGADNIVPVHIRHLRSKIEINPSEPDYLKVVFGQGYKIEGK